MQDVWCYHCCHPIHDEIYHLPIEYDISLQIYSLYGNFCSLSCMKTYNLESNESSKNQRFTYINQYYAGTNVKDSNINFAPCREQLCVFGGDKSIDIFRNDATYKPVTKTIPPVTFITPVFTRHENFSTVTTHSENIASARVINEPTKLHRSKPLKSSQNTLENTMGIFKSSNG